MAIPRWNKLPAAWRLTIAYSLIIFLISVVFCLFLYSSSVNQIDNSFRAHYVTLRTNMGGFVRLQQQPPFNMQAEIDRAHDSLRLRLVYFNLIVLLIGTGASYLLARRTLKPIEEALADQSRFTADASHELRTPLAVMQTEIEVALRDRGLTLDEAREQLGSNLEEIGRLRALSDGLLRLARRRETPPVMSPVDLTALTTEVTEQMAKLAESAGAVIRADLTGELTAAGDRASLRELLVILVDNAIKYGSPRVQSALSAPPPAGEAPAPPAGEAPATRAPLAPPPAEITVTGHRHGRQIVLSVIDNGPGIAAADLPHLFDRFYRADSSRHHAATNYHAAAGGGAPTPGGYGLGLSIAQSIAEMHDGTISAHNAPSAGAVFTVRLPLQ